MKQLSTRFWCDWWRSNSFTLIQLQAEWSRDYGFFDVSIGLLGFNLYLNFSYEPSLEAMARMEKMLKEIEELEDGNV